MEKEEIVKLEEPVRIEFSEKHVRIRLPAKIVKAMKEAGALEEGSVALVCWDSRWAKTLRIKVF